MRSTISVNGTGTMMAAPDVAELSVGVGVGPPIRIAEDGQFHMPMFAPICEPATAASMEMPALPIAPGEQETSVAVRVIYQLKRTE